MTCFMRLLKGISAVIRYSFLILSIIFLLIPTFLPAVKVKGNSMSPTLADGSYVFTVPATKVSRGDICCFRFDEQMFIKRVIAVEGDVVNILDSGTVTVNGVEINESYLTEKYKGDCRADFPKTVKEGCVFVLGDNRRNSVDSRFDDFADVSKDNLCAIAVAVISKDDCIIELLRSR